MTIKVNGTVTMPQTTNGSMVLASINCSTENNLGRLTLTSGGGAPRNLSVQALTAQPTVLTQNWHANNLEVTNTSPNGDTPIAVEAFGPGMPGQQPLSLAPDSKVFLDPMQTGEGPAPSHWMQVDFELDASHLAVFVLIGGPVDNAGNNGYVVAVNSPSGDTGPNTSSPPPPGYYGTSGGNQYVFQAKWGGSDLYVAYLGSATVIVTTEDTSPATATVTLRSL